MLLLTLPSEAHQEVTARFNERFLLSLISCRQSLVLDDELNILPISLASRQIAPLAPKQAGEESKMERELRALKESLEDTQPIGPLLAKAKTLDQGKALVTFIEAISEKTLRSTVALTAARGRGKSAALGLAIAASVAFGYSNIFVTAPSPENLKTLFDFIFEGFGPPSSLFSLFTVLQIRRPRLRGAHGLRAHPVDQPRLQQGHCAREHLPHPPPGDPVHLAHRPLAPRYALHPPPLSFFSFIRSGRACRR